MSGIPLYSQADKRWRDVKLGYSTSLTIGSHGCVVCCLAMLVCAAGAQVDPPTVNEAMRKARAFLPRSGRAIWSRVEIAFPQIKFAGQLWHSRASGEQIRPQGLPVLVEILLSAGPHWVLAVEHDGLGLRVNDPLQPPERQRTDYLRAFYARARIARTVHYERAR